tara:strand:- start:87 stop:191 length:105 start_codon:yes stop_codon:yes gene_type:complete
MALRKVRETGQDLENMAQSDQSSSFGPKKKVITV